MSVVQTQTVIYLMKKKKKMTVARMMKKKLIKMIMMKTVRMKIKIMIYYLVTIRTKTL